MKNLSAILIGCFFNATLLSCDTSAPADPMVRKQEVPASNQSQQTPSSEQNAAHVGKRATVSVFPVEKNGWGYQVLVDNKPYIKQAFIPAIQGKKAFATQQEAQKVGDWVAEQVRQNKEFGVSKKLMDSLGVKY